MTNDIKDIVERLECSVSKLEIMEMGATHPRRGYLEHAINDSNKAITALTTLSEDNAAMKLEIERLNKKERFRKSYELELWENINEHHSGLEDGFWRSCSGCHETFEGHSVGSYTYSKSFKCEVGAGCGECFGLGVVWDNTDYEDMARFMREESRQALKENPNA